MMKKLFYIFIPILAFFGVQTVNAFSLDIKPKICVRNISGSVDCSYKGEIAKFWDNNYWTTTNYLGSSGSTLPINNLISFQWSNYNLCQGKSFLISGYIGGLFGYFDANSSYEFYNNNGQMNCSYTKIDSSRLKFTCSGIGGGDFLVNFNLNSFSSGVNYQPAISQNVDITCNATNDTIITENKQNTQDIINNQNNNQSQTNSRLDEINKGQSDINNSINNSDTSGSQAELENVNDKFKDDISKSPVSDLITLPLKLLTAFNNKLSSTKFCQSLDMGTLFGVHWLELPCINPEKYLGSLLWATIDMISTALLLWSIAHKMVKVYISITSVDGQFTSKVVTQTGGML